jgi:hypothetical protein
MRAQEHGLVQLSDFVAPAMPLGRLVKRFAFAELYIAGVGVENEAEGCSVINTEFSNQKSSILLDGYGSCGWPAGGVGVDPMLILGYTDPSC